MTAPLITSRHGATAIITINREARRNALSRDTLSAFAELEGVLLGDSSVRAIVVTGAGERAFCAGADLKERETMDSEQVRQQLLAYQECLGWLETSQVPVIAAINGVALGGGLELALCCDLRIAAPNAILGLPETSLGIIPGAGGTQRLPRLLGAARAKQLILLNERLGAEAALRWGLVGRVSASVETLIDETLEWIKPIEHGAPIAQAAALAAIDAAGELSLDEGLARERALYERCLSSEDRDEALRAFAEKRRAVFKGR